MFCLASYFLTSGQAAPAQDVSLRLQTSSGHGEFHVGEVIPIKLVFVTKAPGKYELNVNGRYPQRIPMPDSFKVEPQSGWVDPLQGYREALSRAMDMGGLVGSNIPIGTTPVTFPSILNDYVRFSRPGHYTIQVRDSRVFPILADKDVRIGPGTMAAPIVLTSTPLEIIILPTDTEWQEQQLRAAIAVFAEFQKAIDSHARSYRSSLMDGCISLRSLGTSGAADTMIDSLRDTDVFSMCSFQTGLLQYPDRKFVLNAMRQRFDDPSFPVSYTFFDSMAIMTIIASEHTADVFTPAYRKSIDRQLAEELLLHLAAKQGDASEVSMNTLVSICFAEYGSAMGRFAVHDASRTPSNLEAQVLQIATTNFQQLSSANQKMLTEYRTAHGMSSPKQ